MAPAQPRDAAMPLGHDPTALQACVGPRTRLLFMANPNNPTGTWLDAHALGAFLDSLPPEVIVVVDEAYAEMTDAPDYASALTLLARHPNLVVTRTFSKAFGLAGLRCGYAIASPALVAVIERVRESFNVNAMALAAAEAALRDTAHLSWIVERNAAQREALSGALRARGVDVLPSQTNFLLAEFGAATARVEAGLLARDVVLRPMAGYGLPGFSRITIGTADENRKLLAALDEVLA
jgi:histidinol-phosphate aminotransferase